jgi:PAS domain S-box-containing protein
MISHYSWTPQMFPSLVTVVLLILFSIYSWRRRSVPGAIPFAIGCLFAAFWAAGAMMEYTAVDIETRIFWFKFQSAWYLPTATAIACFVLEYAWPGRWLTRRNLILLSIPCLLGIGLLLTDDLHHLAWRGFAYEGSVIPLRGPANWMLLVYGYVLSTVNLIAFVWLFIRSPQHRWPVAIMATGLIVGRGLFLLEAVYEFQISGPLDVPPIAFEYLLYALALFGFRIFDPIPLANRAAIAQMHTGMLVLDPEGRIVSLNPAAERILGTPAKQIKGKPITELLPAYPDVHFAEEAEIEVSLPQGQQIRQYTLAVSPLKDWRELVIGHLLLLHDVTVQKQAQAQLLGQQELLAALHEREQLARELHDSVGQVLGYISMQAQAIRKRAHDEGTASIETQLTRLAEVAQEAHRDIRESIFNLKTGPVAGWSFFGTLRVHLAGYQEHYGILTELAIPEGVTEDLFDAGAAVQLLRVIQEAMANTRKHGNASRVQISFACQDGQAQIVIADDGCGFDLDQFKESGEGHFGMAFMRERMEQIGGSLAVETRPGAGTQVWIHVPIHERQKEAAG